MAWERFLEDTYRDTLNLINGFPPEAVQIAVHGKYDIYIDTSQRDGRTQWTIHLPDHNPEVVALLNSLARPEGCKVSYGNHGWRVFAPRPDGETSSLVDSAPKEVKDIPSSEHSLFTSQRY